MPTTINDIFLRCGPAVRSNISQCGSVTLCENLKVTTIDDLETIYKQDGEYRILEHLLMTHFEIKACGSVQRSMRDFFMANMKVTRKGEIKFDENNRAVTKVAPFIMASQRVPRNNVFWRFTNGTADGAGDWAGDLESGSGIPNDPRSFPVGSTIYIVARNGSNKTFTNWVILTAEASGDAVHVTLESQNGGTLFAEANSVSPVTGVAYRGIPNIGKTESYCDDVPAYLDTKKVPFWIQHTRWTSCSSELYEEWRDYLLKGNPLYREFEYIPDVERQRQMLEDFENRLFHALWFQPPISDKQNIREYEQLPTVTNFLSDTNLGVEGGRCVGRKANAIGWLQQLRECDRWVDAGGDKLYLYSLFDAIYAMSRVRAGVGSAAQKRFDVFTDGITAELLDRAFIKYYSAVLNDHDRYVQDVTRGENKTLGLQFSSYRLRGRNNGVVLNVITDWSFDDTLSEFSEVGIEDAGRSLWFLDMTGMYMKVIESNKVVNHSGDLKSLVAVDNSFRCVEETYTQDTTVNGLTYTAVLECPAANLIIDNFSDELPDWEVSDAALRPSYLPNEQIVYDYGV